MIGVRLFVAVALLAITAARSPASAQDYPNKPIKLIVPTAPAGIGDIIARQMQHKLNESGVTVVVENRPGAAGVIGVNEVAKAPADGYTFLVGNHAVLSMLPHLQKIPYDPVKSFTPVFLAVTVPNILVVHPSVPAKDVKELIAYAKANPGKLTYASQGVGASGHIAGELFKLSAGVDITHVPYKGAAPAAQDLAAGHVSMMFDVVSLALGPIHAGRVRPLAVATNQRVGVLPDVPTMSEQGSPVEVGAWFGFLAPAGTPPVAIAFLNREANKVFSTAEGRDRFVKQGAAVPLLSTDAFAKYMQDESARYGDVIRKAGIKME
ncbi:MAG: tripartite tricarboxylate transporter substrate binding protein [Xanthobacteraceae bacterium]|jgi:tripartite-type tricarboxylate transporter receptor subunit TctC|nr:tripartite tricarboxylate transporter substrate binding protein [Xanthobacteraceae bacterium]